MPLVCLDTQVIIWGIKEQATSGQEDMVAKAKAFIESLDGDEVQALIPAMVVAELLMKIPYSLHPMVNNLFQQSFIVAPFDLQASSIFGKIWQENKEDGLTEKLMESESASRSELKTDCFIVATAVAQGAECIYSHDVKLAKYAAGHIQVREIPTIRTQTKLDFDA